VWLLLRSNASTPLPFNAHSHPPMPSFDCSTPTKVGCVFNLTADPTEHDDLALREPELASRLLARLRGASLTLFDPDRGATDPRCCARMEGPNRGFFGPWLELE